MNKERISMSQWERDVLTVIARVEGKRATQREAAKMLGRTVRQVRRIQRRLQAQGDGGIVLQLRGRPSNARIDPQVRRQVLAAYKADYGDFGPTLAAEKLAERGLTVGAETLRLWLLAAGLWQRRRQRDVHRSRRERRECFGELVQIDTSIHDWLEGRSPEPIVLTALIDDATSKLVARFYGGETTEAHLDLLGRYLRKRGRPLALYSDRDSIYRAEGRTGECRRVQTQFSRACAQLGIELILANSPQAKGRVERLFQTAQDRLVKELRLAKAVTIEQANQVLERTFQPWFNRRCTVKPTSASGAHRPIQPAMNLAAILAIHTIRTVANDYTIRFANRLYQLLPPAWPGLRGGKVTVEQRLDGSMHLRFKQRYLPYQRAARPVGSSLGALPPDPRSLSPLRIPAVAGKKRGCVTEATQPSAVHPTVKRSGRTPALPYPSDGENPVTPKQPYRPTPNHPWR